jgi:cytochrome c1
MAPLDQYLMERNAEIALARSAGPASVSKEADVMVLGRHGYETAVKGTNGFVCMVERSWDTPSDDPQFWNPNMRGPICFNAPAVRSFLPLVQRRADVVLASQSKAKMFAALEAALDKHELPSPESGAMAYMMSKQGYLNDHDGRWHPHVMFYAPPQEPAAWGAGLPGSPMIGVKDVEDRLTVFMVTVAKWSDGTSAAMDMR